MDNGNDVTTFVPPFELFATKLGSSLADNRVSTIAIGIKARESHHNLLQELFSQLFTQPPSDLAHVQYSLCGIATIIRHLEYQSLLWEIISFSLPLPLFLSLVLTTLHSALRLPSQWLRTITQKRPTMKFFRNRHGVYRSNQLKCLGEFSLLRQRLRFLLDISGLMTTWKLSSNSSHPTHNSSNQPKSPLGWIRYPHPIA